MSELYYILSLAEMPYINENNKAINLYQKVSKEMLNSELVNLSSSPTDNVNEMSFLNVLCTDP